MSIWKLRHSSTSRRKITCGSSGGVSKSTVISVSEVDTSIIKTVPSEADPDLGLVALLH